MLRERQDAALKLNIMRKLSYVFYFVLSAMVVGCYIEHPDIEVEKSKRKKVHYEKVKVFVRYTDNSTDTLLIDPIAAGNLYLNYRHCLYFRNQVYANDVRTFRVCR